MSYEPAYVLLIHGDFAHMENDVNKWIKKGYEPVGGICSHNSILIQSMFKVEKNETR